MKQRTRQRRAGATQTFSVSVDPETKQALRQLADHDYGGNLSAVVTDLAEEARRRLAAARYLERHRIPDLSPSEAAALEAEIRREAIAYKRRRKGRAVA